jgi:hypothetical protein
MTSKHVPHDNTYVHTFACTFKAKPKVAAEILYEEYREQSVELAKEILKYEMARKDTRISN